MPKYLLEDEDTIKSIETIGLKVTETPQTPQEDLQHFISETTNITRKIDKVKCGKMNSSIKKLEKAITKIQRKKNTTPEQDTKDQETLKFISDRIKEIKAIRYKCVQD